MTRAGIFETVVGVMVVAVAAAFLVYAYNVSGRDLARGAYSLDAVFGRVDGVSTGAEVRIAGVKVGTVSASELNTKTYEATVKLAIASGIPVPEDSVAKVVSDGVLGGAHIAIEPGASEENLRDGETISFTQGSVDLLGLAVQAFTSGATGGGSSESADEGGQTELDPLGDL